MWMSRLHHRLELGVSVGHDERDNVASQALASPLARTLSKPTPIEEAIRFVKRPPREMSGFVNEVLVSNQNEQDEIDIGVVSLSKPEARWRIGAQYLAPSSALGYHDHQTYVIGSGSEGSLRGPTPVELLAGALTSCTVYYVVHNAVYRSMPVHSIDALAEVTMADDGTIASINKTTTVSGDLTSEQMREIEVMANSCYVGESLKRGICLTREVEVLDSTSGKGETVSLAPFVSCDDESCCIPQMKNAG